MIDRVGDPPVIRDWGAVDNGLIWTIVGVLAIVALLMYIL